MLERHLSDHMGYQALYVLLANKLLQSMVEVVAEGGHRGWLGGGGLADRWGRAGGGVGVGGGQVDQGRWKGAEVVVPSGHLGVVALEAVV